MGKLRWILIIPLVVLVVLLPILSACGPQPTPPGEKCVCKIGGTWSLTGAYAEDMQADIQGFRDYVRYVNENKLAGENVEFEVLWGDDALDGAKALSILENLKDQGILTFSTHASPVNLSLHKPLWDAQMMATTTGPSPITMEPPSTICSLYSVYTDQGGAIVDWFMDNWKEDRVPRFAYLTADHPFGRQCITDELTEYIQSKGMEFVGNQFVPLVATAPPTTQLMWLKENNIDLTFGGMVQPGVQPTLKEAARLGMGPGRDYEIVFGFAFPAIIGNLAKVLGTTADGAVVAGNQPGWEEDLEGIKLCEDLQNMYHPDDFITYPMYIYGVVEAMVQIESVILALEEVSCDELTPEVVLKQGFYKIKNFDTLGLTEAPLTFGADRLYGPDGVRVDQVQGGKQVKLGVWPVHNLYPH